MRSPNGGTERAFSGVYGTTTTTGHVPVRRLQRRAIRDSGVKFDSGTGWPSFTEAIPGSRGVPD